MIDHLMADEQVDTLTTSGEVVLPLSDHLGTIRDLAVYDEPTGETTIATQRNYDAFGRLIYQTPSMVDCLFAFTGRPFDESTGLQNNWKRWYDVLVGRWMSKDPISFTAGDANTYRYVANSPINFTDPSGLAPRLLRAKVIFRVLRGEIVEFTLKNGNKIKIGQKAEYVLKENGKRILVRNAKFINCEISVAELNVFTKVSKETLKRIEAKFPNIKIKYDKLGQPIFTKYSKAVVKLPALMEGKYVADYAEQAWAKLAEKPFKYEKVLANKEKYVWHHRADGALELIDKDLHTAFQHTGLNSILRKEVAGTLATVLIPGYAQFNNGDINAGFREIAIYFTPIAWSEAISSPLTAFYDECYDELYGSGKSSKNPMTARGGGGPSQEEYNRVMRSSDHSNRPAGCRRKSWLTD